jgi:protein-S-isoprenylcysteine O-methyltransferase Ste14
MLTAISLITGIAAFASLTWGIRYHFRIQGRMPAGMRRLSAASLAAFLLFLALVLSKGVAPVLALASAALFSGGTALFWWAVATTRNWPPAIAHADEIPQRVYETGAYAHVRHPFYLAYSLSWIGAALAAGWPQWIASLVLIGWYFVLARLEEKRFTRSDVALQYAAYQARTGMFLPKLASGRR